MKQAIHTHAAPPCIGTYSQAIQSGQLVYLSGQIPLDPKTEKLVSGDIRAQVTQVFNNLKAVAVAAGGNLDSVVRLCIYLTDLNDFPVINEVMKDYFTAPFPARTTIGVAALPKGATVEVDGIMILSA